MMREPLVQEILKAIDESPQEVTDWESNFLDSLMKQAYPLSPKQRQVLANMAEKYLDASLAAELLGQQRLL